MDIAGEAGGLLIGDPGFRFGPATATCNVMRNGASSFMIANRSLAKAILHGTCHSR